MYYLNELRPYKTAGKISEAASISHSKAKWGDVFLS